MNQETKDLIEVFTAVSSTLAAIVALGIAVWVVWVAITQRRIQEKQMQQDLFDKYFAIYTKVAEFVLCVLRADGKFEMRDFRRFLFAVEEAEFLFGQEVNTYMQEIREKAKHLYPKAMERHHKSGMLEDASAISNEVARILEDLSGPTLEKRREVFKPYLQLYRRGKFPYR